MLQNLQGLLLVEQGQRQKLFPALLQHIVGLLLGSRCLVHTDWYHLYRNFKWAKLPLFKPYGHFVLPNHVFTLPAEQIPRRVTLQADWSQTNHPQTQADDQKLKPALFPDQSIKCRTAPEDETTNISEPRWQSDCWSKQSFKYQPTGPSYIWSYQTAPDRETKSS